PIEARRRAQGWLPEQVIVQKVFDDLAKRYPDRNSGYSRITRLARRVGDSAPLMLIELMPGVDATKAETPAEEKPRRRRLPFRRGAAASTEKQPVAAAAGATKKTTAAKKTTRKKTAVTSSSKEA